MEYNASAVKYLFWFVETKETARLLNANSMDEVRRIVIENNLYQQKSEARLINEFGCIKKRLEALPEELRKMMVTADIRTAKLIAFIGCMASDKLLFDLIFTKQQTAIENALRNAEYIIQTSTSAIDKALATKKKDKYVKQLVEMKAYYQALSHIAMQRIGLDLDEGVKKNYARFQGVEVSNEGEKKQTINLLAKI